MKKKFLFLAGSVIAASVALACLNEHHVDKQGRSTVDHFELGSIRLHKQHNKAEIEKDLDYLLKKELHNAEDSLWNQNDIAVQYIKLGRLSEAEAILSALIKKYPNDYNVVVNLGTLYELQGKNKQALQFIKRAMTLEPESHNGSEWFHIKVLEFKLKNIPENRIIDQDILGLRSIKEPSETVAYHVIYQLEERIPFTPAPNLAMAKILQEYGDYLADSISIKGAYVIYEVGMVYDSANILHLSEKRNALLPYFKKYKETIPRTGNHYFDNIVSTIEEKVKEDPIGLLEKGLNYLQDIEKKNERKRQQKRNIYLIIGAIVGVSIAGLLAYRARQRKQQKRNDLS